MARKLRVLIAAAEVAPFAKEGGLADVVSSLPRALSDLGVDARVIVPCYGSLESAVSLRRKTALGKIFLEVYPFDAVLLESELPGSSVPVYFVENSDFFGRPGIYNDPRSGEGFVDNFQRFVFFMKAVLVACQRIGWIPDVIHCNDSQTGLIPAYLKLWPRRDSPFRTTASLFTIHNLAYQGRVGMHLFKLTDLPRYLTYPQGPFEFYGDLNLMKSGIVFADIISTVSPTYSREIQGSREYGLGLETVLRNRRHDIYGVLNGIDTREWDPSTDPLIAARYGATRLSGKSRDKAELQRSLGLQEDADVPLLGMISRLADQKGLDLLLEAVPELVALELQFVLLGAGHRRYHDVLETIAQRHRRKFSVNLSFDDRLAHWIEAGSDMFLMPSRYEPCGLNQMYSLRYGTVPIVRHTGGLADTVTDCHQHSDGNGFTFHSYSCQEMMAAVRRALQTYQNKKEWRRIMRRGMSGDFSWRKSAQRYAELYRIALQKREQEHD